MLYNLRLAWQSLRQHPVLSCLILLGIALGVGVSTWLITIYHIFSQDPLPGKSSRVSYVRMDSWDPLAPYPGEGAIPTQITYREMRAVMASQIPLRKAGMFKTRLYLYPESDSLRPFREEVRLTFRDFFPMFEVPFRYGGPWSAEAEVKPEAVVVLGEEMNRKLFGGSDSVGKKIRIADRDFTVVGVLDAWEPQIKLYDMTQSPFQAVEQVFIPLPLMEPMEITSMGNRDGWKVTGGETFMEQMEASEAVFIQMWVELPNEEDRRAFHAFLDAYVGEQKKLGRFERPLDNRVTPLRDLIVEWGVVPQETKAMAAISLLFLLVSALNLVGLFLGKFLSRASVVGVRRALGASRRAIFLQHIVEAEVVGLAGGALGLLLASAGLWASNRALADSLSREGYFHLDAQMVAAAVGLSLVAGFVAGIYPAWRICTLPPAQHLKAQ